jgi:hypothetical protein
VPSKPHPRPWIVSQGTWHSDTCVHSIRPLTESQQVTACRWFAGVCEQSCEQLSLRWLCCCLLINIQHSHAVALSRRHSAGVGGPQGGSAGPPADAAALYTCRVQVIGGGLLAPRPREEVGWSCRPHNLPACQVKLNRPEHLVHCAAMFLWFRVLTSGVVP